MWFPFIIGAAVVVADSKTGMEDEQWVIQEKREQFSGEGEKRRSKQNMSKREKKKEPETKVGYRF